MTDTAETNRILELNPELKDIGAYQYGWHDKDEAGETAKLTVVSEDVVRNISAIKDEPDWMLQRRLKALKLFEKKPMPSSGCRPVRHQLR